MLKLHLSDPEKRAKELHAQIKHIRTQNSTTTSVLNTKEGYAIVGSSEDALRKELREQLESHEKEAKGSGHAEEKVIEFAHKESLTPTEIGASRPICSDCEDLIKENNIIPKTEFSGKKSKKRQ